MGTKSIASLLFLKFIVEFIIRILRGKKRRIEIFRSQKRKRRSGPRSRMSRYRRYGRMSTRVDPQESTYIVVTSRNSNRLHRSIN